MSFPGVKHSLKQRHQITICACSCTTMALFTVVSHLMHLSQGKYICSKGRGYKKDKILEWAARSISESSKMTEVSVSGEMNNMNLFYLTWLQFLHTCHSISISLHWLYIFLVVVYCISVCKKRVVIQHVP